MFNTPDNLPVRNETANRPDVQVGYCAAISEIASAKAAGFDYVELRTAEVAALPDASYEQLVERLNQFGIEAPAANTFLPRDLKVTGPLVDEAHQMTYVRRAFDRVSRLGVRIIVFGSGGARQIPNSFSRETAFQQLASFCHRIAPEAEARGITVVIEPLRKQECNLLNTAREGLELVRDVSHPNVQLLVDFYHMAAENEDPRIICDGREHIRHLHIANPVGRGFPLSWEEYDYASFFENLRWIEYAARISVEARASDFEQEAPRSIALLRRAFASSASGDLKG